MTGSNPMDRQRSSTRRKTCRGVAARGVWSYQRASHTNRAVRSAHGTTASVAGSGNSSWSPYWRSSLYSVPPTTSERESSTLVPPYMFRPRSIPLRHAAEYAERGLNMYGGTSVLEGDGLGPRGPVHVRQLEADPLDAVAPPSVQDLVDGRHGPLLLSSATGTVAYASSVRPPSRMRSRDGAADHQQRDPRAPAGARSRVPRHRARGGGVGGGLGGAPVPRRHERRVDGGDARPRAPGHRRRGPGPGRAAGLRPQRTVHPSAPGAAGPGAGPGRAGRVHPCPVRDQRLRRQRDRHPAGPELPRGAWRAAALAGHLARPGLSRPHHADPRADRAPRPPGPVRAVPPAPPAHP